MPRSAGQRCVFSGEPFGSGALRRRLAATSQHFAACAPNTFQVICTIGPSCWAVEKLIELIDAGMNVARLNFSHGDHARHGESVAAIRKASEARPGSHVAIMLDTKGMRIRDG